MPLALGFVGAGAIAGVHAEAARRLGMRVAGVWDTNPAKGPAFAEKHPGVAVHASLDALLADRGIPAVVVAVPNAAHADVACRALAAGKHVLLEKPMATSTAECDRIIQAMERAGKGLQMGFVYRQAPLPRLVASLIAAGRLGRIYHAKASMYRRRGVPGLGGWFTTRRESGGGPLIDLGVHVLDMVLHLCGQPAPLRASGACYSTFGRRMKDYVFVDMWAGPPRLEGVCDVEDHATALVRFAGGLTVEINVTWAMNIPDGALPDGVALFGERGGCHFPLLGERLVLATEEDGRIADVAPVVDARRALERAFESQLQGFAAMVETNAPPLATAAEGRRVQSILDAIAESSAADREVEVRGAAAVTSCTSPGSP